MQSGTVELASGRWRWTVQPRFGRMSGATVVFEHQSRFGEEMRTWAFSDDPSPDEIRELAREPVTRTWIDGVGDRWEITVELSSARPRPQVQAVGSGRQLWLTFKKGMVKRAVPVPESLHLGELRNEELAELLERAG